MQTPRPRVSPEATAEVAMDSKSKRYITAYWNRARHFNQLATTAYGKRQDRLNYLVEYCQKNGLTEMNTRKKIEDDWIFNDANDDWIRYSREAARCQAAIETEYRARMMLGLPTS